MQSRITPIPATSEAPPSPPQPRPAGFRVAALRACLGLYLALGIPIPPTLAATTNITATTPPNPKPSLATAEARLLERMAAQGTNTTLLFQIGDLCHDAGVEGDKKAVERAELYLRQLLTLDTNHAPALALLGSVYTLKGRDAFWPNVQLRLVHEGNRYMDQALRADPENLQARLIRAFNNAHMPDFLGRTEIVRADLAWLAAREQAKPGTLTPHQRQELALHQGRQLRKQHRTPEALRLWESARAIQPDSDLAREITAEINKAR